MHVIYVHLCFLLARLHVTPASCSYSWVKVEDMFRLILYGFQPWGWVPEAELRVTDVCRLAGGLEQCEVQHADAVRPRAGIPELLGRHGCAIRCHARLGPAAHPDPAPLLLLLRPRGRLCQAQGPASGAAVGARLTSVAVYP